MEYAYILNGIDEYNKRATDGYKLVGFPAEMAVGDVILFENVNEDVYKSVDPWLLELHAALSEVMYLSAAGEAIDHFLRDLQDTQVLATDGSSAELLHAALAQLIAVW
jgi:hypothetical protein